MIQREHAGSGLDRHEHIGLGRIGKEGLGRFINHDVLEEYPSDPRDA